MDNVLPIIKAINDELHKNMSLLNDLDQQIGDGDHGTNVVRGCQKIVDDFDKYDKTSYQTIFKSCAMTIITQVGGSSGPLIGTALLEISKVIADNNSTENWYKALQAGFAGIEYRGHSHVGEKTMLDALGPVVDIMGKNLSLTWPKLLLLMVQQAEQGLNNTKDLLATKGRASYLQNRSIGHLDPGAYSIYLIFKALYEELYG